MDAADFIDALGREGALLTAAVERADPDARVPSCPDWSLRELVHHTGGVQRWATRVVQECSSAPVTEELEAIAGGWPDDQDLAAWFRAGHALLVDALRSAPDDLDCWAFLPSPSPRTFWARRQAHEAAIHRVDAELASGPVTPFPPAFAADGIDELLTGFLPRSSSRLRSSTPRSIAVVTTDTDTAWIVHTSDDPPRTVRGEGKADVVVRGAAADVYLLVWNRADPDRVEVDGDASLLDVWRSDVRIRWS